MTKINKKLERKYGVINMFRIPKSFIDEIENSWQLKHTAPHTKEEIIVLWNELPKEKKEKYKRKEIWGY